MAIIVDKFIKSCASGAYDPKFNVIKPDEWLQIINFQAGELFPEVGYRGTTTFLVDAIGPDDMVDLSAEDNIWDIKEVYLVDQTGREVFYDHWIFNRESMQLDMSPRSNLESSTSDTVFSSFDGYVSVKVYWYGFFPTLDLFSDTINLSGPKLVLLQKICIRESLRRVLMDHTKLDRYRTLVSRINEYALIGIIRDYTTDIELSKRRLADTLQIRTY